MNTTPTKWFGLACGLAAVFADSSVAAEAFKVVKVIPASAQQGRKMSPATRYPGQPKATMPMASIGDPVVHTLDQRLEAVRARALAAEADAAARADAAAQAEPQLPEEQAEVATDEQAFVLIVGLRPPGFRAEAPWTYHPRSRNYSGTRPPRYYQTTPPRYGRATEVRYHEPSPPRPWGYQATREAYRFTIQQLSDLEQQFERQLQRIERDMHE